MNFWQELKNKNKNKPILCLAPMADVTDAAFRFIVAKYSKQITPHKKSQRPPLTYVTYTEFVSADGLVLAPEEGRRKLLKGLEFSAIERPIVAQFFTSRPEMMEQAAALAVELGFDGVDINMGCPDKSIEKQKAGAALIKDPKLAREIIVAAKQGTKNQIPVSVKTRLGYNKDELESWLPEILAENPAAIVLHARTRKEMSKVPARWERVGKAVKIRDELASSDKRPETILIGNGDVLDIADAYQKCAETGADGAMIGRGIFGRPWLMSGSYELDNKSDPETAKKVLNILIEHTKLFEEKFKGFKSFALMKKFFKSYLSGIPNTKELREKLMQAENADRVEALVKDFLVLYY